MGYTSTKHLLEHASERPPDPVTVASGSWFEAACGASGLGLAVFGMLGNHPALMAAIATILVGFGVFAQAGTIAARSRQASERDELVGISIDLVAGVAGFALGVLVLLRVVPLAWLPLAAMALGAGLLFAGPAELVDHKAATTLFRAWSLAAMMLAGLAAIVLALLAFTAVQPFAMLSLAAVACVGAGLTLAGAGTLTTLRRTSSDGES